MKRDWYYPLFILCVCLLAGCHDDDPDIPSPPATSGDGFEGEHYVITLVDEMEEFRSNEFTCVMHAPDGTLISREGNHHRLGGQSTLTLKSGLKEGVYRLLYLKTPQLNEVTGDTIWTEYGLGCRVEISDEDKTKILDTYSRAMQLSGSGTEEHPFIISSYKHLERLRNVTNDQVKNNLLLPQTHFRQIGDIDMYKSSSMSDSKNGWLAIGNTTNNPFRGIYDGGGYTISNLWSIRKNSAGIGLFGYTEKTVIKHVRMENPKMEGNYAVGSLVGATTSAGNSRDKTALFGCTTTKGYIKASNGSVGAGGLVGVVNMYGMLLLDSCINNGTDVSASYAAGGLLGAGTVFSQSYLQQCENHATITTDYTGAGGLVGSVDSLFVSGCINTGEIHGSTAYISSDPTNGGYGTGGLAGGAGVSAIYASTNEGVVEGHTGVGGLLGSTRIGSEELLFNNALIKSCKNIATVTGQTAVGGICGEAQLGCYAVYNTATVTARASNAFIGGIAGNTSIAVIHNAINTGVVNAESAESAGGIVGKTTWGAFFASQNFGDLTVKAAHAGGMVGLAGNYTMVNYCTNTGFIKNTGNGPTGGLIGRIGDPREWSAMNTFSCVIGSVECIFAFLGPALAVSGKAFKNATTGAGLMLKNVTHVLQVGEATTGWLLVTTDKVLFGLGVAEMVTEGEASLLESSLKARTSQIDEDVQNSMNSIRSGYSLASDLMSPNLNTGLSSSLMNNLGEVLNFYENSDENSNTINYNINKKREDRYEHIEENKQIQAIVQKSIAGACICVATVASVAGAIVTAGSSAAVTFAVIGGITTIVGGANAIIETSTDFENNAVIVSQCVNMGRISAKESSHVGGIAGQISQYCWVRDCLNGGRYEGSSSCAAGIIGRVETEGRIDNCMQIGNNWKNVYVHSSGDFTDKNNLRCYDGITMQSGEKVSGMSLEELCNAESSNYDNWDIRRSNSNWQVTEGKGNFPLPFHSEMEKEVKVEN